MDFAVTVASVAVAPFGVAHIVAIAALARGAVAHVVFQASVPGVVDVAGDYFCCYRCC